MLVGRTDSFLYRALNRWWFWDDPVYALVAQALGADPPSRQKVSNTSSEVARLLKAPRYEGEKGEP